MVNQHPALNRLLQLTSPMLPVGAYSYSQGLEWAIDTGTVHDLASAQHWIGQVLRHNQATFDLPILVRLYQAWIDQDVQLVMDWNQFYLAGRDTSESLAETRQMGFSLVKLLNALPTISDVLLERLNAMGVVSFPTAYAGIAAEWGITESDMLQGYAWGWLENQASAAMKAVPLGQVAGQTILLALADELPTLAKQAQKMTDSEISNFNPLFSLAGCLHETQYSRLFRS